MIDLIGEELENECVYCGEPCERLFCNKECYDENLK